ncbi:MAG TPA: glutamate synthase central domain-containing protein, partial [Candidatus Hydrogenedentes bacterium]|nr:glutamate synthase central domain-containing protein [Candidatus Hydrogenedentota bacterium]
ARCNEPDIRQVFVAAPDGMDPDRFETRLFITRKRSSLAIRNSGVPGTETYYAPSFSSRTIVYKGLMLPEAMDRYYEDLRDDDFISAIALVHQRYSTNTMPSWPLAQPFRFLAHNGEINTLRGNINMFASREHQLASPHLGDDVSKLLPVLTPDFSDSAIFDNAFELLVRGGYPIQLAMAMMIPEPWSGHESMPQEKKDFYRFMACKMEPWDGPASMTFSDGTRVGAVLDRNGLRPSRYWVTRDGRVIMASEAGVLDVPQQDIIRKGRLQPGRMFFVDTAEGRIVEDDEIKESFAKRHPYGEWLSRNLVSVPKQPDRESAPVPPAEPSSLLEREVVFGYTVEDREILIGPMAETGQEPVGSMGNDEPLAVLSSRPQLLYNYFKQLFAQVTNPPIDPIREEIVMSLETTIGREGNLLAEHPDDCRQLHLPVPILTNAQTAWIKGLDQPGLRARTLSMLFPAEEGPSGVVRALDRLCAEAEAAVDEGCSILVLSDRGVSRDQAALPALLATGGVHHHLVRKQKRTLCGIVVESGEPREVMHFCLLLGYGAGAVNPWLAFEVIEDMFAAGKIDAPDVEKAKALFIKAVDKGILKTMSKIGISTLQSYRCAQIFEALGLSQEVVDRCFAGTASRIAGIDFEDIGRETLMRHGAAWPWTRAPFRDPGGRYRWRRRGEFHQWNPVTIAKIQHATRLGDEKTYEEFAREVNDRNRTFATLRGLLRFRKGNPIPLEEVEPAANIVKRFCTGAMSFGSI